MVAVNTTTRGRVTLDFDVQGALAVSRNLGVLRKSLPGIQLTAIKTLRRRLPVFARRDIQAEYDIPAARVRKDLSARDTPEGLRLIGHFRGIGLRNFRARQTRRGVTASVLRGRRTLAAGAFFATLSSGNEQVVEREGEKRVMTQGRYKGQRRQPIVVRYGATVAQMLAKGRRPERIADHARGVLASEVERLIEYYLGGRSLPANPSEETP